MANATTTPLALELPTNTWLLKQVGRDDVYVLLAVVAFLSYRSLKRHLSPSKDIPDEFWYQVPQSTQAQAVSRQEKADARNIVRVLDKQVRQERHCDKRRLYRR